MIDENYSSFTKTGPNKGNYKPEDARKSQQREIRRQGISQLYLFYKSSISCRDSSVGRANFFSIFLHFRLLFRTSRFWFTTNNPTPLSHCLSLCFLGRVCRRPFPPPFSSLRRTFSVIPPLQGSFSLPPPFFPFFFAFSAVFLLSFSICLIFCTQVSSLACVTFSFLLYLF